MGTNLRSFAALQRLVCVPWQSRPLDRTRKVRGPIQHYLVATIDVGHEAGSDCAVNSIGDISQKSPSRIGELGV